MTSEAEIGYIAGLLEGEGCFTFVSKWSASIYLKMTDYDVVLKAALIMGVNPSRIRLPQIVIGNKQEYEFSVFSRDAIKWMRIIRPYMGDRRGARIDEIVNAIISKKPFYELGTDYCPKAGHSLRYPNEYKLQTDGSRNCRRCQGARVWESTKSNNDPNYIFINPFGKRLSQGVETNG